MKEAHRQGHAGGHDPEEPPGDIYSRSSDDEVIENEGDVEEEEFHWEDEDEPELDEHTLLQIKRNDPDLKSIEVHDFDYTIDGEDAGHFIGQSPHLEKLLVKGESMLWEESFKRTSFLLGRFWLGLAQNRSIKHLMMRCCDLSVGDISVTDPRLKKLQKFTVMKMTQFCEQNTNLQSLKIECGDLGNKTTRVLAVVLSRKRDKSSLKRINLYSNEIDDRAAGELIESLEGYDNLVELSLAYNLVGGKGCAALGKLVSRPECSLKELNLGSNEIDDGGIATLAKAFAQNRSLKEVDLGDNAEVTEAGWQHFFTCLEYSSSSIERLDLGANSISDKGITSLGNALLNNTTLNTLDLSARVQQADPITAKGWRSFFTRLQVSKAALQDIHVRGCSIDDEGLAVVADAVSRNSNIKILDLSKNPHISPSGWRHFFTRCLQSPDCPLEGLFLCENLTEEADELMADLTRAISCRGKLEAIDLGDNPSITEAGWGHFSRLLCDRSSVDSIFESNHVTSYFGPESLPQDLDDLAKLNEHEDKKEVAREKILHYYFRDGANVQELVRLKLNVLPHAMSWLGKDCSLVGGGNTGHTPLYQLFRSSPSLVESRNIRGAKRKRCENIP